MRSRTRRPIARPSRTAAGTMADHRPGSAPRASRTEVVAPVSIVGIMPGAVGLAATDGDVDAARDASTSDSARATGRGHGLALARRERDPAKAGQPADRRRRPGLLVADVNLHDLVAGARARVLDGDGDLERAARRPLRRGHARLGVAEGREAASRSRKRRAAPCRDSGRCDPPSRSRRTAAGRRSIGRT